MKTKGFTLIELLVVIAIIGLLASIALASLDSARAKARDAKRLADLRQMTLALNLFFDDNGRYPTEGSPDNANAGSTGRIGVGRTGGINTILANYMGTIPTDPLNDSSHYYYYDGLQTCGSGTAPVLAIRRLETLPSNRTELCNSNWGGEGGIGGEGSYMEVLELP